jgi:hypothetical protein
MPSSHQPLPDKTQLTTTISRHGIERKCLKLDHARSELNKFEEAFKPNLRIIDGVSRDLGESIREFLRWSSEAKRDLSEIRGLLTNIDNENKEFLHETSHVVYRDQKLKDAEFTHDRRMKKQAMWFSVAQRALTTLSIIAIMVASLIIATKLELPVPRLIAPVTAGSELTCKEEKAANLDALRLLFGTSGALTAPR